MTRKQTIVDESARAVVSAHVAEIGPDQIADEIGITRNTLAAAVAGFPVLQVTGRAVEAWAANPPVAA